MHANGGVGVIVIDQYKYFDYVFTCPLLVPTAPGTRATKNDSILESTSFDAALMCWKVVKCFDSNSAQTADLLGTLNLPVCTCAGRCARARARTHDSQCKLLQTKLLQSDTQPYVARAPRMRTVLPCGKQLSPVSLGRLNNVDTKLNGFDASLKRIRQCRRRRRRRAVQVHARDQHPALHRLRRLLDPVRRPRPLHVLLPRLRTLLG